MFPTLLFLATMTLSDTPLTPGEHTRALVVGGRQRSFLVHVPRSYAGRKPVPVVLAFHGGGSNARQMEHFCGLSDKAEAEGFVVVYPNGTGRTEQLLTWNGGNCCGYAQHEKVDDVEFVRRLL